MSRNVKFRMQQAAHLLLEGHTSKEVATMLKARPETLSRWKKRPEFIEEIERIKAELCDDMRVKLWRCATTAFNKTIQDVFEGEKDQKRFNYALRFFETIGIHQIFQPIVPPMPQEQTYDAPFCNKEEHFRMQEGPKSILERLEECHLDMMDAVTNDGTASHRPRPHE